MLPKRQTGTKTSTRVHKILRKVRAKFTTFIYLIHTNVSKVLPSKNGKANLSSLPLEVLCQIFDLSTPRDLIHFCKTSSGHLKKVLWYLNSKCFVQKFQDILMLTSKYTHLQINQIVDDKISKISPNDRTLLDFAPADLAHLIRICHLSDINSEKNHHLCTAFFIRLYLKMDLLKTNEHNDYWGKLISELTWDWNQWDFYEFIKEFVTQTKLRLRVENYLCNNSDEPNEELALRRIIRSLFLDNYIKETKYNCCHGIHFRLAAILHLFAPEGALTHRLMFLLGAPINTSSETQQIRGEHGAAKPIIKEFIDYNRIIAEPITDMQSAHTLLGDLPKFVKLLLHTSTLEIDELRWSELEIFNFLEMLTTYPEPWVLRNFASLLVMEPELARVAVCIRASHGDPVEAGSTLFSCVEASVILGFNAEVLLRATLHTLARKCSIAMCLTVLRGAISNTYHMIMEILGNNDNVVAFADLDETDLKNALVTNNQIAGLFLNNFHQIFP